MSEKWLEDVVTSALFKIRARQCDKAKAISWLRVRPTGPTDLSNTQIAEITGFTEAEVRYYDESYRREVAEMGKLLRDFIERADRVLEFRRLLESFDDDFEIFEDSGSAVMIKSLLGLVLCFVSHRGSPLFDSHSRDDLLSSIRELMGDNVACDEAYVDSLKSLRMRLDLALEMATPRPLADRS